MSSLKFPPYQNREGKRERGGGRGLGDEGTRAQAAAEDSQAVEHSQVGEDCGNEREESEVKNSEPEGKPEDAQAQILFEGAQAQVSVEGGEPEDKAERGELQDKPPAEQLGNSDPELFGNARSELLEGRRVENRRFESGQVQNSQLEEMGVEIGRLEDAQPDVVESVLQLAQHQLAEIDGASEPASGRAGARSWRGHTESTYDLCRLSGVTKVGILAEMMHDDGTMYRRDDSLEFSRKHGIPIITVPQLAAHIAAPATASKDHSLATREAAAAEAAEAAALEVAEATPLGPVPSSSSRAGSPGRSSAPRAKL
ncbi:unnamed protein product [Prorocentrum cordatum]|uniref:3,4-dihydroxy-2-butanone 4-phosphate synthase n=1 Tax=Prorocentrum cordatum TaxID=2364126 RepID=A0ABN9W9E0_9DINO|nr:unnamed protein product [Polarella glacialis]